MKKYLIFAGVNGAGKTTFYQTDKNVAAMPRVNVDEIVRDIGNWNNPGDVLKAGRVAVGRIREFFAEGISFNQETTLCGRSIISNIEKAKTLGYRIEVFYVGLASPELAVERVARRVEAGGHGIPKEDILRRYDESMKNLLYILPLCDSLAVYDNTDSFRRIAVFQDGQCIYLNKDRPQWFDRLFQRDLSENDVIAKNDH